jgi:hypothetical protein
MLRSGLTPQGWDYSVSGRGGALFAKVPTTRLVTKLMFGAADER